MRTSPVPDSDGDDSDLEVVPPRPPYAPPQSQKVARPTVQAAPTAAVTRSFSWPLADSDASLHGRSSGKNLHEPNGILRSFGRALHSLEMEAKMLNSRVDRLTRELAVARSERGRGQSSQRFIAGKSDDLDREAPLQAGSGPELEQHNTGQHQAKPPRGEETEGEGEETAGDDVEPSATLPVIMGNGQKDVGRADSDVVGGVPADVDVMEL